MKDLSSTPYERSFLDEALRRDLRGDDLYREMEVFTEKWHKEGDVGENGHLRYDRRLWGITWDEFGLNGLYSLVDAVVESYRRDISVIQMLEIIAANGEPFPEDQEDAKKALVSIDIWGQRASLSRSVAERLDPNGPFIEA